MPIDLYVICRANWPDSYFRSELPMRSDRETAYDACVAIAAHGLRGWERLSESRGQEVETRGATCEVERIDLVGVDPRSAYCFPRGINNAVHVFLQSALLLALHEGQLEAGLDEAEFNNRLAGLLHGNLGGLGTRR